MQCMQGCTWTRLCWQSQSKPSPILLGLITRMDPAKRPESNEWSLLVVLQTNIYPSLDLMRKGQLISSPNQARLRQGSIWPCPRATQIAKPYVLHNINEKVSQLKNKEMNIQGMKTPTLYTVITHFIYFQSCNRVIH